jgi:hypothetical protein
MEETNAVEGMKITSRKLPAICEGCIYGKMCRRSFQCSTEPKTWEVGELIVSDIGGPMQQKSLSGALYYVAMKDKASGYRHAFFIKEKSEVVDNGTEYGGQNWIWVDELGIKRQYTIAYTPQQNGVSERDNRTIVEAARSALYGRKHPVTSHVLLRLWAEAINYAVYTLNHTLSQTRNVTAIERYSDKKRQKLDRKAEKGMFLGYDMTSTGFRVLILSTLKVVISDEVKFEEDDEEGLINPEPSTSSSLPDFPFAKQPTFTPDGDLGDRPIAESPLPITNPPAVEPQATEQPIPPSLGENSVDPLPPTELQTKDGAQREINGVDIHTLNQHPY